MPTTFRSYPSSSGEENHLERCRLTGETIWTLYTMPSYARQEKTGVTCCRCSGEHWYGPAKTPHGYTSVPTPEPVSAVPLTVTRGFYDRHVATLPPHQRGTIRRDTAPGSPSD
jgi:hypothetical protein